MPGPALRGGCGDVPRRISPSRRAPVHRAQGWNIPFRGTPHSDIMAACIQAHTHTHTRGLKSTCHKKLPYRYLRAMEASKIHADRVASRSMRITSPFALIRSTNADRQEASPSGKQIIPHKIESGSKCSLHITWLQAGVRENNNKYPPLCL